MTLLFTPARAAGALMTALAVGLVGLAAGQSANPGPGAPAAASGHVIAKGPGYSIVAASPAAGNQTGEAKVTDAPLETLHEPIVCQGQRVLSIDNRNIRFEGNAITVEDGCELHISNSRISAGGIAIRARNASVHIENSEIEGRKASIDAAGGAQIYAETSTFKGAARRLGEAAIHDLGNNVWD
jgi:Right handed beta helix region